MEKITFPLIPMRGFIVFPHQNVNFDVRRGISIKSLEKAMENNAIVFLGLQKDFLLENPTEKDIYKIGVALHVTKIYKEEKNLRVLGDVLGRYQLEEIREVESYFEADGLRVEEETLDAEYEEMLCRTMKTSLENYSQVENIVPHAFFSAYSSSNAGEIADIIIANLPGEPQDKVPYLLELDPAKRALKIIERLEREKRIVEMRKRLQNEVGQNLHELQRESFLREEMNLIQKELGDSEETENDLDVEKLIRNEKIAQEVRDHVAREYKRMQKFPSMSQEYSVARDYLDRVLQMPWVREEYEAGHDLAKVRSILDNAHYGMDRVKKRIVEFAAARLLNHEVKAPVICLVGPPGVGKTSIASGIAEALKRPYVRVSLGGVRDEAEIRGHRKTYVGAMPGRIANALMQAGHSNPVMLLDEIDKMASDLRGDPTAALLEVLDSSINKSFRDAYLELPIDLSDVFFITTANTLDGIPLPLYDRMEIIQMDSYSIQEKMEIAKNYLIPRQRKEYSLNGVQFKILPDALEKLISDYTHEAGVRELERLVGSLCRKAVCRIVSGEAKTLKVKVDNLEALMDEPPMKDDDEKRAPECGIVNGLAWTQLGGEVLTIETALFEGSGNLKLTGQMGDVMKESAQIALSIVRSLSLPDRDAKFFKEHDIHIHIPAGAVPKDGPSAGVTLTTALYSVLSGKKVRSDVAMTGEISLRGKVLPIGGLKEKLLAAKRKGICTVLVPILNRSDVEKLPAHVTEGMNILYMERIDQVLSNALVKE